MKSIVLKSIGAVAIALSLMAYLNRPVYSDWDDTSSPYAHCWYKHHKWHGDCGHWDRRYYVPEYHWYHHEYDEHHEYHPYVNHDHEHYDYNHNQWDQH